MAAIAFVVGTVFGSFANVVIYRVPRGMSIVTPGSACPSCGAHISWWDNLPILSYLFLRARCRNCGSRISARYPLIEFAVGSVWLVLSLRFGFTPVLPAFLAMGTTLVILSAIDLEHRRIPNRVLVPASILACLLLVGAAVISSDYRSLGNGALGAMGYGLPLLAVALFAPGGMGGGDIKLAVYLGAHLGWLSLPHVAVGAFLAFLVGGTVALGLLVAGRKGRKDPIPFGPFMAAGALVATLSGQQLANLWLGLA
jgi:leader peptidase (prepilin peptidase)/N-methyltransferase